MASIIAIDLLMDFSTPLSNEPYPKLRHKNKTAAIVLGL